METLFEIQSIASNWLLYWSFGHDRSNFLSYFHCDRTKFSKILGDVSESHLVYGLYFSSLSEPDDQGIDYAKIIPEANRTNMSMKLAEEGSLTYKEIKIFIFLGMLCSMLILLAVGIYIYILWENHKMKKDMRRELK